MDTRDLTNALREATEDLAPRPDFAEAVVSGGRRRRTRTRLGAAALATTAAAVVAAVVVVGSTETAAPPPGQGDATPTPVHEPKVDTRMTLSGGNLLDDKQATARVIAAWTPGLDNDPAGDMLADRLGEPHVYWHGTTPAGPAAVVMQTVRLAADDRLPPAQRGQEVLAIGLVTTPPGTDEPRLIGLQVEFDGLGGHFLMPDDRTVVALSPVGPDFDSGAEALWVSDAISYDEDGRSQREWESIYSSELVTLTQLPEGTNPLNVRLVISGGNAPPARGGKMGAHLDLLITSGYPAQLTPVDRGLGWKTRLETGQPRGLERPEEVFTTAVRDSGLLDASSYTDDSPDWTVVAGMADGRTVVLGEWQELDNPAQLYAVLLDREGRVRSVEHVAAADRNNPLPVVYRLPDEQGTVVAAFGEQLSWRGSPSSPWSEPVDDVALLPPDATEVQVGSQVVELGS
ncbi:hypothetical protein [Actinophytocola xanthii]|uniref:Uncharacterized protein n=1 Tax=Actinophytocola xanthii TaxID=1912961 RepID=A0A1Q8CWE8_9PSEU|nr:hypothetical protein [Actinophytocola xanthii]OLF18677.1 hypothetical protein BU204_05300 [Actinophytocola xanthii]